MVDFDYRSKLPLRLGQVVVTPAAKAAIDEADSTLLQYLIAHSSGDWGVVDDQDAQANNDALLDGTRILSAYVLRDGKTRIWIITEADRSSTTILLPEEY